MSSLYYKVVALGFSDGPVEASPSAAWERWNDKVMGLFDDKSYVPLAKRAFMARLIEATTKHAAACANAFKSSGNTKQGSWHPLNTKEIEN